MLFTPEVHGRWTQERIEREIATAALLRHIRPPTPSIRQAVGHRFIRIGARLAAEPSLESARSR
jgi:hypothetical protein